MQNNEGVVVSITGQITTLDEMIMHQIREVLKTFCLERYKKKNPQIVLKFQIGHAYNLFSSKEVVLCEIKGRPSKLVVELRDELKKQKFDSKVVIVADPITQPYS